MTFACDLYADIAPAYQYLLKTRWPDCLYDVVYVTNSKKLDVGDPVYYIKDRDIRFAWRFKRFVDLHYDEDLLLLMMIDYLPVSIDSELVQTAVEVCRRPDVKHVRLRPMPPPQEPFDAPGVGMIDKTKRYALSLQPGIWETDVLYDLCNSKWSAHQVETRGSGKVKNVEGKFLCTEEPAIVHVNYYRKRKVLESDLDWVKDNVPKRLWPDAAR